MISRGFFTKHLVTELGSFALPVGDNDVPSASHGWQGEPNESGTNFIPWLVLAPGTATRNQSSFGESQEDWQVPYFLTTAGVSREQTESVADKARVFLKGLDKQVIVLKDENWKLTYVECASIGAVSRITSVNPAYQIQTDSYTFWLSKEI